MPSPAEIKKINGTEIEKGRAILIVTTNISTKYCTSEFAKMGFVSDHTWDMGNLCQTQFCIRFAQVPNIHERNGNPP